MCISSSLQEILMIMMFSSCSMLHRFCGWRIYVTSCDSSFSSAPPSASCVNGGPPQISWGWRVAGFGVRKMWSIYLLYIYIFIYLFIFIHIYMCVFLKCWYPTTMCFPTRNDHFGVFWGYHHLRKHPYIIYICIYIYCVLEMFLSSTGSRWTTNTPPQTPATCW